MQILVLSIVETENEIRIQHRRIERRQKESIRIPAMQKIQERDEARIFSPAQSFDVEIPEGFECLVASSDSVLSFPLYSENITCLVPQEERLRTGTGALE